MLPAWSFPFTPTPPDWRLDWSAIVAHFPAIARMAGCPQHPIYHAEGDVLTHTRMVVEALIALPAWRALEEPARSILFAAALFHDVGKPLCTRIEEDGRITSRGHVPQGARYIRHLFWLAEETSAPFAIREQIVALIRHSGLPFYFLEEPDPRRAVVQASQTARLDWLTLLAEADLRGRICPDAAQILERIALFGEFCAEHDCLDKPRRFASDHGRFVYFRKPDAPLEYDAYDDTRFEVVLMSALPGTGKDTWIARHCPDWPVISLDDLRTEMGIAHDESQGAVLAEARLRARVHLRAGRPFVWNATNTIRSRRSQLVDLCTDYGARVRIVYLEADRPEVLRRNRERMHVVPEAVIYAMAARLEVPDSTEAQRVEWHVG